MGESTYSHKQPYSYIHSEDMARLRRGVRLVLRDRYLLFVCSNNVSSRFRHPALQDATIGMCGLRESS